MNHTVETKPDIALSIITLMVYQKNRGTMNMLKKERIKEWDKKKY